MDVLIENGRVLTPDGFEDVSVAIEDGVIASVGSTVNSTRQRIDARGAYTWGVSIIKISNVASLTAPDSSSSG